MDEKFEVVISGISGKFPECDDVPEFRDKLYSGKSFMSLKDERWPTNYRYKYTDEVIPAATGKFKYVKEFDVATFKINYATAECTDVINRKVLEPSFEAVMDAGINPYELDGRNIAVYMACAQCDSDATAACLGEGRLWVLGSSKTMMSNRVSFALNLRGPSYTLYNDMFGNLIALNEAYKNVSKGHVEAAIVGVTSAVQHPYLALHLTKMNFLSMDAITRVFDKAANGYGRSESVVVLYIQRAEDAKRIYGTIDFSGYTYYGSNPNSILAFEEDILARSLNDLYSQYNYKGIDDTFFIEMSACGLKRYDRIEANAIADVLCKNRKNPLLVGSVKSNMGNAENSAPFVSLVKAIFALESGTIVQNLNLESINDNIRAFAEKKLQIVTKPTPLSSNKVAVNSVGMTGALSQVVLRQNSKKEIRGGSIKDGLPRLALICGRTEDGTKQAIQRLERTPFNTDFVSLLNEVFSTDMPFHIYRGYSILSPNIQYKPIKKNAIDVKGNTKRPVWFIFSGMGSQWNGMGKGLLDIPIFAETVQKCHEILKPKDLDIYHIITTDDPTIFDNIVHAFVGIITIQIALVEILNALGIKPDGIIGHSVGENACAYADGCLTLEQAVLSSYARGVASIETDTIQGMMAAVGKGYHQMKNSLPPNIEIACHNSSTSCTLSGPAEEVNKYVQQLQDEKIFAKAVNVSNIAYHSKYIAPAAPNLLLRLQKVIPTPTERSSKWISTSIAEYDWDKPLAKSCSAEYLTNNLLNHVLFEEGCKHIPQDALVIEIAPHGLLQAIMKRSLPETCTNVSLTRRNDENKNIDYFLSAIGELYIAGCNVNVNSLYPSIKYPVPRETPSIAPFAVWYRTAPDAGVFHFDLVGSHSSDPITVHVNDDSPYYYLKHHRINNQIILPISLFLYLTWWVFSVDRNTKVGSLPIIFEDINLFKNINISLLKPRSFTIFIQRGSGKFEILKCSKSDQYKTTLVMTGVIQQPTKVTHYEGNGNGILKTKHTINSEQFYNVFKNVGYQLTDLFCGLEELTYDETDSYGKIKWDENWVSLLDTLLKFSMFSDMKTKSDLLYPKKIRKLEISASKISSLRKGTVLHCYKDSKTKIIICDGLMMSGVENEYFEDKRVTNNLKVEGLRFVSHKNPRCHNITEFVKLCLQIALENMATMVKKGNAKLNVVENIDEFQKPIRQIMKECDKLKHKLSFCSSKEWNKLSKDGCFFIITDNFDDMLKNQYESLFLLIVAPFRKPITIPDDKLFVEITKQSFSDSTIHLLKKRLKPMNGHVPYTIVEDANWTSKYISVINKSEPIFIVRRNVDSADLSFMLSQEKNYTEPRKLLILDEEIPQDSILKEPIIQDLHVAVFRNGEWGSYKTVLDKLPESDNNKNTPNNTHDYSLDIQIESICVQYLSFDNNVEQQTNKLYKYGIEYSGLHYSGEKVMGLSSLNTFEPVTKPDSDLKWTVPRNWNLEDAVTIPFAYAQAFNILDIVRGKIFTNSILINVGDEASLAEACISISLHRKYLVYVTVTNNAEAARIKKKFSEMEDLQIINEQISNYEIEILKTTNGLGVDVVINCLPGIQHISASLNCVAKFGHCVHVANVNPAETYSLGLRPFLNSISFIIVPNKISTLLNLPKDDKRKIKTSIEKGIKTGVVIPLDRNVQTQIHESINKHKQLNYGKTVYKRLPENEILYNPNQKLRYDNNRSYIIVGDKKDSSWFELVDWLINKGARKFVIAVDNFTVGSKISHQMNRLLNHKNATIILTSAQKVSSVQSSVQLIEEANKIASLEAIFFISVESDSKKISNLDVAAQRTKLHNVHFISLFSSGLKECEHRRYKGYPALVIHGEKSSRKLSSVLPQIDDLLGNFDNSNSPTLYRITNEESNGDKNDSSISRCLPHDIQLLESIGESISNAVEFTEVTTLSPRFSNVKNITPIYVISALGPKPLEGLLSRLMYPTFCATLSESKHSATELASKLYKSLNRIQSKGGVTMIAETWTSPVAFELSNLLERDNRKYRLFILEGHPLSWKERVKNLGLPDAIQFENNLIAQIFDIGPEMQTENLLNSSQSLTEKINGYLSHRNYTSVNALNFKRVINVIRSGLTLALNYEYKNELIRHTVFMTQHSTEIETLNLSITSEWFTYEEEDYHKFLNSVKISQKINDDVVYNIWYNKE